MDKQAIQALKRYNQTDLEGLYRRLFESPDGKIVLEDLKARFFEYKPTNSPYEAGQQSVLIHIKNMIEPEPVDDERTET